MEAKQKARIALAVLMAAAAGCAWFRPGARIPPLQEQYRSAAAYKSGESRENWAKIEAEIRESQADAPTRVALRGQLAAMLMARLSPDAAMMACRQLAVIGTPDEVPALATLVRDPAFADAARYALERIPGPEADAALRGALAGSTGGHRIGIINSLGVRRDAKAVGALGKLAVARDEGVRSASIEALGKIGGDKSVKALRRLPEAGGEEVASALLACAERYVMDGENDKGAKIFEEIWRGNLAVPTRTAALAGWLSARAEAGIPLLMEAIQDKDDRIAAAAQRFARDMPGGFPATLGLADRIQSLGPSGQIRLMRALAERGDVSALAPVGQAARSHDKSIRIAAYEALGRLGDATIVSMLLYAAGSAEPDEAHAARAALCAMPDEHVDQALVRLLETMDEPTRLMIVETLAARRSRGAAHDLIRTTQDPSPSVRRAAWKAVGASADHTNLTSVIEHLVREKNLETLAEGVNAATAIIARSPDPAKATAEIARAMDAGAEAYPLLWVLGKSRGDIALDRLTKALRDSSWQDRAGMIVDSLSDWNNAAPADALLEYAKTTKSEMYRGTALGGYVRLTALYSEDTAAQKARKAKAALALARSNEERRGILHHARDLKSLEGLDLLKPFLEDPDGDLRALAAESAVEVARAIAGANPSEAKSALRQAAEVSRNEHLRAEAGRAIAAIEAREEFLTAWEVSGPWRERNMTANEAFAKRFPPEDPAAQGVEWKPIEIASDPEQPWKVDLAKAIGGENRAAYLRTQIWSPKTQSATLELGSDDGVKAWLNGALIHENNTSRGIEPGQDKVTITLKEGWNALLLKVVNGGADWAACARVRGLQGERLEGLKFKTAP